MAGTDDRNSAYNVPPEMREFVRKRDQRKCLLCGASNTPPDTALIVAGSPWDEIEVCIVVNRSSQCSFACSSNGSRPVVLCPNRSVRFIHRISFRVSIWVACSASLTYDIVCPNHHELFLHRRWCFVPCFEDRHAMRMHEEQDMRDRLYRRGTLGPGHSIPRTVPQVSLYAYAYLTLTDPPSSLAVNLTF
jgi:hypothetical protein